MPRRISAAPTTGQKPQTGRRSVEGQVAPVIGLRLGFLVFLHETGRLEALAAQERRIWRQRLERGRSHRKPGLIRRASRHLRRMLARLLGQAAPRPDFGPVPLLPSPLTAPLRLAQDGDPRPAPAPIGAFDPRDDSVAVIFEFLGRRAELAELGVFAVAQSGDIFVGWANLRAVPRLANHPAIVSIDAVRSWLPSSVTTSGPALLPFVPPSPPPPAGLNGQGTRIACLDLSFDFLNPAFTLNLQQTRIRSLRDMPLQPGGTVFDQAALQTALDWFIQPLPPPPPPPPPLARPPAVEQHLGRLAATFVDFELVNLLRQHGTAVAGIALGTPAGVAVPPDSGHMPVVASGTASAAEPLFIAIGMHDEERFANNLDVHAAFLDAFADPLVPCIGLMANSDNLGGHDGSLCGEVFLDNLLLEPGRAIVLTAGNANHRPEDVAHGKAWHAAVDLGGGGTAIFELGYGPGADWTDSAEIWFEAPAGMAAARISALITPMLSIAAVNVPSNGTKTPLLGDGGAPIGNGTKVTAQLQFDSNAHAWCLRLVFVPSETGTRMIQEGTWTIAVDGVGMAHAWLDRNNPGSGRWISQPALDGAGRTTLGSPAVSARPLAVGSVGMIGATNFVPSGFSGRGPVRQVANAPVLLKPDLVAVGEQVNAPLGSPIEHLQHSPSTAGDYAVFPGGTSYAAPQVAGACALVFQHFGVDPAFGGSPATWADVRQMVLQAATRLTDDGTAALDGLPAAELDSAGNLPAPPPGQEGWDRACGHGLLSLPRLIPPASPAEADVAIRKAEADDGAEPFVAAVFWASPAMVLEDRAGRPLAPADVALSAGGELRLAINVRNRGQRTATGVRLRVWWAPLGALHPLPGAAAQGSQWRTRGFRPNGEGDGNQVRIPDIEAHKHARAAFLWTPEQDGSGRVLPAQILAAVEADGDAFDPEQLPCALNNTAFLTVAATRGDAPPPAFSLVGGTDADGIIIWRTGSEDGLVVTDLPVTALPWREASLFQDPRRRFRPLFGEGGELDDPAVRLADRTLQGPQITQITEVRGARLLTLREGQVQIEGGSRLVLPRLRIAPGSVLRLKIRSASGNVHLLHLNGGRRVGGATISWAGN